MARSRRIGICTAIERAPLERTGTGGLPARPQLRRRRPGARAGSRSCCRPTPGRGRARRVARRAGRPDPGRRRRHRPGHLRRRAAHETSGTRPERDAFEIALAAARAGARHPAARHLPRHAGHERRPRRHAARSTCPTRSATRTTAAPRARSTAPTMTCGSRRARSPRARPARSTTDEVATITRGSPRSARASSDRLEHARRAARGDRGPRAAVRPGRAVAPGGGPDVAPHRGAGGGGGTSTRVSLRSGTVRGSVDRSNASRPRRPRSRRGSRRSSPGPPPRRRPRSARARPRCRGTSTPFHRGRRRAAA